MKIGEQYLRKTRLHWETDCREYLLRRKYIWEQYGKKFNDGNTKLRQYLKKYTHFNRLSNFVSLYKWKEALSLFYQPTINHKKKYYVIFKSLLALPLSLPHAWCSEQKRNLGKYFWNTRVKKSIRLYLILAELREYGYLKGNAFLI